MNNRLSQNETSYRLSDLIPDLKNHRGEKADTAFIREKYLDLPYAGASPAQKLDLYLPSEGQGPYPVILYLHGGGFISGDKTDWGLTPVLQALHRGYAISSANYRLCTENLFPAQVFDVKAAVRFLRANAATYKLDAEKIIVWGESAGGYLALMAAFTTDVPDLEDLPMGNPAYICKINAVVNWFAPCDTLGVYAPKTGKNSEASLFSVLGSPLNALLGRPPEQAPAELAAKTNPVNYVSPQAPPIFIQHGSEDLIVPLWQSEILANLLSEKIGTENVCLSVLAGAKHGGPEFHTPNNINRILDFLDRKIKGMKNGLIYAQLSSEIPS